MQNWFGKMLTLCKSQPGFPGTIVWLKNWNFWDWLFL